METCGQLPSAARYWKISSVMEINVFYIFFETEINVFYIKHRYNDGYSACVKHTTLSDSKITVCFFDPFKSVCMYTVSKRGNGLNIEEGEEEIVLTPDRHS